MFDPEKVERFDESEVYGKKVWAGGEYVLASDYDQLLALYRNEKAKAAAFADTLQKMHPNTGYLSQAEGDAPRANGPVPNAIGSYCR